MRLALSFLSERHPPLASTRRRNSRGRLLSSPLPYLNGRHKIARVRFDVTCVSNLQMSCETLKYTSCGEATGAMEVKASRLPLLPRALGVFESKFASETVQTASKVTSV